jgi:DNA primase
VKTLPEGMISSTLKTLGVDVIRHDGDELVAQCPGHKMMVGKSDNNPSWSINTRTGVHFCFSCGFKGNVYTLVRDLKDESTAKRLMDDYDLHGAIAVEEGSKVSVRVRSASTVKERRQEFPESHLALFDDPPDWALHRRRLRAGAHKKYGVLWDDTEEAWILPLRYSDTFRLMGYQAKAEEGRYFRNRPRKMPKATTLFGIDVVQNATRIVVVESPLDAVLLADMDYPAVAICGARVSEEQIGILRGFDFVYFWLDNDHAGDAERDRLRRTALPHSFVGTDIEWKDPGDTPLRIIDDVLDGARL